MLIHVTTTDSAGVILDSYLADLDVFFRDNIESLSDATRRAILMHPRKLHRIDIMGGMFSEIRAATLAEAKAEAKRLGFSISQHVWGEYRLAPYNGTPKEREDRAYYTNDLGDAIGTARQQARRTTANDQ